VARKKGRRRKGSEEPATSRPLASETAEASADPPSPPPVPALPRDPPEGEPIVADLAGDLDTGGDYESLVAAVANMPDDPAPDPQATADSPRMPLGKPPATTDVDDSEVIHDLDEDDGQEVSVDRLIARVGSGAPVDAAKEEPDEDLPVIDLDDHALPASVRTIHAPGQPPLAASRLAQAAAVGWRAAAAAAPISLDHADVSTPEARARLLAEALAHAERKEARYRASLEDTRRHARWKSVAASVMLLLAGFVAVDPPAWVRPEPPAQLTEGSRARGIRLALLLQAQQVEAYRVRTQQLPATLEELPGTLPGIRYARSGGRSYQLVAFAPDGSSIVYDSADPSPAFRVLGGALASPEDGP
jgi:hypothetical protein